MDTHLQELADYAIKYSVDLGVQYCDARAEEQERKSVLIENGETEHVRSINDVGIGIRLVKDGTWSFCSITNPKTKEEIKNAVEELIKNSVHYAKNKKEKFRLHPNDIIKKKIDYKVLEKPDLEKLIRIGTECNKIISNTPKIIKAANNGIN